MIDNGITIGVIKLPSSNVTPSLPDVLTIGDRVVYRILSSGINEYYLALGDQTKYILTQAITSGEENPSVVYLLQNVFPVNSEIILHNTNREKVVFRGGDGVIINDYDGNWLQVLEPYEKIVLKQTDLNAWKSVTENIYPEDRNNKVSYILDDPKFKEESYLNILGMLSYFELKQQKEFFCLTPEGNIINRIDQIDNSDLTCEKNGMGDYTFSSSLFTAKSRLLVNGLVVSTNGVDTYSAGNNINVDYSALDQGQVSLLFFNKNSEPVDSVSLEFITIIY